MSISILKIFPKYYDTLSTFKSFKQIVLAEWQEAKIRTCW
jgi:hypothetical protein